MQKDLLGELDRVAAQVTPQTSSRTQSNVDTSKPVISVYMTEIKRYPDGREFIRSWLVKKGNFQPKKKLGKKKELDEVKIEQCEEEVY